MQAEELRLVNFCQHRDRTLRFGPGLNCLVGPIGAGKSNILNGLAGVITNNFRRVPGVKQDNIRLGSGKNEASGVTLTFTHKGEAFTLERWLNKPAGQDYTQLLAGPHCRLTKDAAIRETLFRLLGVNEEVLEEYVFVKQWSIFSLLAASPETRAKSLQQLFGTDATEKVWEQLGQVKLPTYTSAVSEADAQLAMQATQDRVASLQTQLDAAEQPPVNWAALMAQKRAVLQLQTAAADATAALTQLDGKLAESQRLLHEQQAVAKTCETELDGIERWLQEESGALAAAAETLQQAEAAARLQWKVRVDQAALQAAQQTIVAAQQVLTEPLPGDYLSLNQEAQLAAMRAHQASRAAFLREFSPESKKVCCPTCGTPVDNLRELHRAYQEAYPQEQAILDQWEAAWVKSRALDRRNEQLYKSREDAKATVARLQRETAVLPQVQPGEVEKARAYLQLEKDKLRQQQRLQWQLEAAQASVQAREKEQVGWRAMRAGLQQQFEKLTAQFSEQDVQIAKEWLAKEEAWRVLSEHRVRLAAELQTAQREETDARRTLEHAKTVTAHNWATQQLSTHLEEVRAVFHRSQLPRIIAETKFEAMLDDINDMLRQFELPFTAELGEGLQLLANFGKYKQPVNRLSGGQMVLFALALRIAVYRLSAADIGLLCLDEPTAGLAQADTRCLGAAFAKLRNLAKSTGLQVILVTHDPTLASRCDRIIEV